MNIRKFKPTDSSAIESIYNRSRMDEFYKEQEEFSLVKWNDDECVQSILNESEIYVCEKDEVLGFCGYVDKHINWLFVSPESRGAGVASQLLSFVLPMVGAGATLSVGQSNERARNLYTKHGFTVEREFAVTFQSKELKVCRLAWSGKSI